MNRHIGLDLCDGFDVGRDPRAMTAAELEQLGHARVSPLRALRLKCLDCCNHSAQEVRLCTAVDCPSWPFRMGKNPWRRKLDQEERVALRARLVPNGASEPMASQKTGDEIDASPSDGVTVPEGNTAECFPTEMSEKEGDAS